MEYLPHRFLITAVIIFCCLTAAQKENKASLKTAQMLERRGDWDSAIAIYTDIFNNNRENYRVVRSLKNIYRKSQRYQDGIQFLRSRLLDHPNDIQLYVELGEFHFLNDQIDEAKAVWQKGLTSFQKNQSYYRFLLSIYGKYGLDDEISLLINKGRQQFGPAFLSQDLGYFYQARRVYDRALDEYILNLLHNPRQSASISRRILTMSDEPEAKQLIETKLSEAGNKHPKILLPTLADHYFKHRQYSNAYDTYFAWAEAGFFDDHKWLTFAKNLRKEGSYSLANDAYQFALQQRLRPQATGQALLGLAKTFEDQIIPIEKRDIIPYFFDNNLFFKDPFQVYSSISPKHLESSLNLYDSILVSLPKSSLIAEAHFRLAEIQYRIVQDFDKALKTYKTALRQKPKPDLHKRIILRIGDVLLAKGNAAEAIAFLDSMYHWQKMAVIRHKLIQIHLFSGNPDTALTMLNSIISTIPPLDKSFNDVMELQDILSYHFQRVNHQGKDAFEAFLRAELYLRQQKISEAGEHLSYLLDTYPNVGLVPLVTLRLALILLRLNQPELALEMIPAMEKTPLADKGIILSGQIYEQIYNDRRKALEYYLRIINEHPQSVFSEPIRYHIRQLKETES